MCTKIKLPKMRGRIAHFYGTCLSHLVGFVAIPLGLLFPKAVTSMLAEARRMPKTLSHRKTGGCPDVFSKMVLFHV